MEAWRSRTPGGTKAGRSRWRAHGSSMASTGACRAVSLRRPASRRRSRTTGLVALSFRLLGVGLWQGRLPIALCMLGALALLAYLARALYGRRAAVATLLVLLLTPMHRQLHPLLVARQVLAEPAMLLFLLAGHASLLLALRRSRWWLLVAALAWALALMAKIQTLPFWIASVLTMLALAGLWRRWDGAAGCALAGAGALLGWRALLAAQAWLFQGHSAAPAPLVGLYGVTALVPIAQIRYNTIYRVVLFGLPTCIGLAVALWRAGRAWRDEAALLRWGLLALAGGSRSVVRAAVGRRRALHVSGRVYRPCRRRAAGGGNPRQERGRPAARGRADARRARAAAAGAAGRAYADARGHERAGNTCDARARI